MYDRLIGTRAQVMHGTAYKTSGGLTKKDLIMNKHGRIVSKTKHNTAKRENRLVKAGYTTKKGHFGFVKKGRYSRKGGDGMPMGVGFPNSSPLARALSGGRKSRRHYKKGGNGVNYSLSPSHISGIKGDSGVDLQIIAGNAG